MQICDFANSYIRWTVPPDPSDTRQPGHMPWGNSARIQLDARCEIVTETTGKSEEFFLISPCRTEWMYRTDTLFQVPNHEYVGAWSRTEAIGLGSMTKRIGNGETNRAISIKDAYTDFDLTIRHFPNARHLENADSVVQATVDNLPLVGITELRDETSANTSVVMEYPIKTMNIHPERTQYQVDTGPILFADLDRVKERTINRMRMAFVCYNRTDVAEFVLRTSLTAQERCLDEYTEVRRLAVRNTLYCADQA